MPRKRPKSGCIDKAAVQTLYGKLHSVRKVALALGGVSHETVRCLLRDLGVLDAPVVHTCNDSFFSMDTPESFYWAGFIAADGCVKLHSHKYKQLSIGLAVVDIDHLRKFKAAISFSGPVSTRSSTIDPSCELSLTSSAIFDDLARFGIVPRKSLTLSFPRWLETHHLVHHFLRGYNDGDGSFYVPRIAAGKTTKQLYVSVRGTKQFLTSFKTLLETNCAFERSDKKPRENSGIHTLEYGGNRKVLKIRDYLYKDSCDAIRLSRKYDVAYSDVFVSLPENCHFKPVVGTSIATGETLAFKSIQEAALSGFTHQSIGCCCRGKYKTHRGYTWAYATNNTSI
jgi:hypothetical protein